MDDAWEQFSEVVRAMSSAGDLSASMEEAVAGALLVIPNAQHAGVSMVHKRRRVDTISSTDALVRRGDDLQYELGEGPCLQAIYEQETVQSDDLLAETRWPTWSARAAEELGVRSMLCLQLFVTQNTLGCLNLYSTRVNAFDAHDRTTALALAAHIAVALTAAQDIQDLESTIINRTVIGQAQGMLMQRYAMDSSAAFAVLVRVSQHNNRRLHEVARDLVNNGITHGLAQ